jgi:hypothetical protein
MRRLAAVVLIAALFASAAAAAKDVDLPDKPRPMRVVPSPPKAPRPAPEPPALPILPPARIAASADQCSLTCAQTYYFCLSGEETGPCGPEWGQCRAQCSPSATPSWRWRGAR